jgi:hypothetical protein
MLHSHLLDMFRAFSNPPNTSNVRPQQGSKLSKPPWFQFIDFARSWSEKTLLSDGFLLESSPWHNESNIFMQLKVPWPTAIVICMVLHSWWPFGHNDDHLMDFQLGCRVLKLPEQHMLQLCNCQGISNNH